MEKLLNEFTVNRPIGEAWTVLTDLERIAPCMPGAQLEEVEGDVYRGVVKVKLGAISTAFKGQASFVERDDEEHRAVLKGEGRDTGGKGNADALITATLDSTDTGSTRCVVETDLKITGKVAQFGRGIMGDVSHKLIGQFATNLNTMLDQEPTTDDGAASTGPSDRSSNDPVAGTGGSPAARRIEGPPAEPIELSGLAGAAVIKRLLPALAALAVLVLVVRRVRRTRR